MATKSLSERVLAATVTPKTKRALATKFNVSYGHVSAVVNALANDGLLVSIIKPTGKRGRPAKAYQNATA